MSEFDFWLQEQQQIGLTLGNSRSAAVDADMPAVQDVHVQPERERTPEEELNRLRAQLEAEHQVLMAQQAGVAVQLQAAESDLPAHNVLQQQQEVLQQQQRELSEQSARVQQLEQFMAAQSATQSAAAYALPVYGMPQPTAAPPPSFPYGAPYTPAPLIPPYPPPPPHPVQQPMHQPMPPFQSVQQPAYQPVPPPMPPPNYPPYPQNVQQPASQPMPPPVQQPMQQPPPPFNHQAPPVHGVAPAAAASTVSTKEQQFFLDTIDKVAKFNGQDWTLWKFAFELHAEMCGLIGYLNGQIRAPAIGFPSADFRRASLTVYNGIFLSVTPTVQQRIRNCVASTEPGYAAWYLLLSAYERQGGSRILYLHNRFNTLTVQGGKVEEYVARAMHM